AAHALPVEIQKLLDEPAAEFAKLRDSFVEHRAEGGLSLFSETLALANANEMAAQWFETQARALAGPTHSDELFVIQTFSDPAREAAIDRTPSLNVPRADYIVTLDADSIIAPQYALRLIEFAQRPENSRVAVVQTPYSAEPNPPGIVERIAGATTDMQYLIHQ